MFFLSSIAFSLPKLSQTIGMYLAIAGLAGIAFLAFLVFTQGREIKELRKWVEGEEGRTEALLQKVRTENRRRAVPPAVVPKHAAPVPPTSTGAPIMPQQNAAQKITHTQQQTQAIPVIQKPPSSTPVKPATTVAATITGTETSQASQPVTEGQHTQTGQQPTTTAQSSQKNPVLPPSPTTQQPHNQKKQPAPTTVRAVPKHTKPPQQPSKQPAQQKQQKGGSNPAAKRRILAVVVAFLIVLGGGLAAKQTFFSSSSKDNKRSTNRVGNPTDPTTPTNNGTANTRINHASINVTVLNATTVNGLAAQTATKLKSDGYKDIGTGTAPESVQQNETTISYIPGKRRAANEVARSLNIDTSNVQPVDAATQTIAPNADVIITLGNDQTPNQPTQ